MSAGTPTGGAQGGESSNAGGGLWGSITKAVTKATDWIFDNAGYSRTATSETFKVGNITWTLDLKTGKVTKFNTGDVAGVDATNDPNNPFKQQESDSTLLILGGAALFVIVIFALRK